MTLKTLVPWWGKLAAKVVLSRLPAGYRVWERVGLFVHGAMDDPEYAFRVINEHVARAGWTNLEGRTVVELGPGDSLATAVIAPALGGRETWLVDAGAFARTDLALYVRLSRFLESKGLTPPPVGNAGSLLDMLAQCGAHYETGGLESLSRIPTGSVDLIFSQAVLEHVRRAEFSRLVSEMRRILRPGGVVSHQIDLKDHLAASLNNLRFSERTWESDFMARSGFYTNRLRHAEIVARFEAAGFGCRVDGIKRWDALPLRRASLDPSFQAMGDEELRISQFDIVARPRHGSPPS